MKTTPAVGTPKRNGSVRSRNRHVAPRKHTLAAELIAWMGGLTLSGGDLDGQPFEVWGWEKTFHSRGPRPAGERCPEYRSWMRKKCVRRGVGDCRGLSRCAVARNQEGGRLCGELISTGEGDLRGRFVICDGPGP